MDSMHGHGVKSKSSVVQMRLTALIGDWGLFRCPYPILG
jgi:hypothetical protein